MSLDQPIAWTAGLTWPALLTAGVLVALITGACTLIVRRTSGAILTAGLGALVCTVYSGDTSWNFARDHLGMADADERLVMFAAGEIALLACAVMARANKRATATEDSAGTPGVPGVLVWGITGIQLVPAFAESGLWAGLVRAVLGPVMAALLWHLAMGLEIRVSRPEALSTGLPAQIAHELRERLLSRLGLAVRGRDAAQLTRDRATARAVRLASRSHLGPWGRAALKAAVARSGAASHGDQRHQLMQLLAARRTAAALRDVEVASPWVIEPAPEPHPATPLGVTSAHLRRMDPIDAVLAVAAAYPYASPEELSSLSTQYGVPVSATQVRLALRPAAALTQPDAQPILAVQPQPPALAPAGQEQPETELDAAVASALAVAQPTAPSPQPDTATPLVTAAAAHVAPAQSLVLDLAPQGQAQLHLCTRESSAGEAAQPQPQPPQVTPTAPTAQPPAAVRQPVAQLRSPDADAEVLAKANRLNTKALADTGKPISQRQLQRDLGIGQRRAQRIHAQLPTAPTTAAAAQPDATEASAR